MTTRLMFDPRAYLPETAVRAITDLRVDDPDRMLREAEVRRRRPRLTLDGRLVIIATDHPGRRVTAIGADALAMADRHAYLARGIRALLAPGVDGIMSTTDFMEDLLILSSLARARSGRSFLDEKVLIGCMNRGGHDGTAGEIDDRFTSFSVRQLKRTRFEGGKMMYRADPADARTIRSIADCAQAITELYREGLYAFLEPLRVQASSDGYQVVREATAVARDAGAAAALGESSARTWLKLPVTDSFDRVAAATTLPILLLGGPRQDDIPAFLGELHATMHCAANVRGLMVGRNLTFVRDGDPRAATAAAAAIVHGHASVKEAVEILENETGRRLDELAALSST